MRFAGRTILVTGASLGVGLATVRRFHDEGAHVVLMARRPGPLEKATQGLDPGRTMILAADVADLEAMESGIAAIVNRPHVQRATHALRSDRSLLPAGVTKIEGTFQRGDAVLIKDQHGNEIARGLTAYSSEDAAKIFGHNSNEIETILGYRGRSELVHRDDLVLKKG